MLKKLEMWYQTDLDFNATKQKLLSEQFHRKILGDMQDNLGRLTFRLKDTKSITYQATTKGKLGIYYPEETNIENCLELVKPYLAKVDGRSVEVFTKIKGPGDRPVKNTSSLSLLKELEEKLGSEIDLGGLPFRVQSLNDLMQAGTRVSLQQAEETKVQIESDIEFIRCGVNEDDPRFSEKETLLNAFRDHLKLAVDSLVKQ